MRFLAFVVAGALLGFLAGIKYGEWASYKDAGFFSFAFIEAYVDYYSTWGALLGGVLGGLLGFLTAD